MNRYIPLLILAVGCGTADKKQVNEQCTAASDCADNICFDGICAAATPEDNGQPCAGHGNCKSFYCVQGVCIAGNRPQGFKCLHGQACTSGVCQAGACLKAADKDAGPPDAGIPDLPLSDMPTPDAPTPDAPIPDAPTPDAPTPDAPVPDAPIPDAPTPDAPIPDAPIPDQLVPDSASPDTLSVGAAFQISNNKNAAGLPAVASGTGGALVVWRDLYNMPYPYFADMYGARLDSAGKVLDSTSITLANSTKYEVYPSVASVGSGYLAAWHLGMPSSVERKILGARVDGAKGTVLDIPPRQLYYDASKNAYYTSVASDGKAYLVTWSRGKWGSGNPYIYGLRVSTAGLVQGSAFKITKTYPGGEIPAAAFCGANYFVAWRNSVSNPRILGARVSTAGQVLDTADLKLGTGTSKQDYPAAAGNKGGCLVVWEDWTSGGVLVGSLRKPDGTLAKAQFAIGWGGGYNRRYPSVATDGTNFLVVWQGSGKTPGLFGRRVSASGQLLDANDITFAAKNHLGLKGASAGFDGKQYLVTWSETVGGKGVIMGRRVAP